MNEDFVPFDLAKKLKEKGFNQPCLAHYTNGKFEYNIAYCDKVTLHDLYENWSHGACCFVDAPTISQVLKWLRKEKKIFICIDPRFNVLQDKFVYRFYITNLINQDRDSTFEDYNDWETAALEGIEYCLDYLI